MLPHEERARMERRIYAVEVAQEQISEVIERHEANDQQRFKELKEAIEANSVRTLLKDNMKWIAFIVVALASGTSGVSKLIEMLPHLLK